MYVFTGDQTVAEFSASLVGPDGATKAFALNGMLDALSRENDPRMGLENRPEKKGNTRVRQ